MSLILSCLFINDNCAVLEYPFVVKITGDKLVADLAMAVKTRCPKTLGSLARFPVKLWKPKDFSAVRSHDSLDSYAKSLHLNDPENECTAIELDDGATLHDLYPSDGPSSSKGIHVVAQLQLRTGNYDPGDIPGVLLDPTYLKELTFTVPTPKRDQEIRPSDIDPFEIENVTDKEIPPFLQDFRNALKQRRVALPDSPMNKLLSETLGKSFDRYFVSSGPEGAPVVTSSEAGQYIHILSSQEVLNKKNFKCNKVGHLGALFFHDLAGAFRRLVEAADSDMPSREALTGIGTALPLPLFAAPRSGLVPRLRYNATTDFRLGLDRFPHLIIQVTPTSRNKVQMHRHPDRIRTILQASSLARLGNALRQDTSRPVVIVAIFIDSSLYLHEYHVYQPDPLERKVVYHRKDGSLHRPELAFEFIFRLYNLLSRVLVDNALFHGSYGLSLEKLDHRTEHYPPISLGTISLQSDDDDYQSDPPEVLTTSEYNRAAARLETIEMPVIRKRKNVFEDPLMKKPLGTAGYKLSSRYDHWDIMKLKPKMHVAIAPDTSEVLLKLSDGHSNELLILRFLSTLKSSQNRAIEFFGVLDFPIGTVMVLPWKPPIKKPHMYPVSWQIQFLEGVAFLHEHKIAHLDLNPNNVVFDKKDDEEHAQLWIIDFGLSLFVEDDETTVEGYCGTRDWTAPEVGTSDERDTKFSAIMADRWSCGKMLDYLDNYHQTRRLEGSEDVMRLREELSRFDPRARPSVREVLDAYLVMEKRQVDEARKRSAEEKGTGDGSQKRARGSAGGDAMDTGP